MEENKPLNYTYKNRCWRCGKVYHVAVNIDDLEDWLDGKFAQVAFPYLDKTDRESLISKTCPKCQGEIFNHDKDS